MNYNRMTVVCRGGKFEVYKMRPQHSYAGSVSGGGARRTVWAKGFSPRFSGTYAECISFIDEQGAQFMSDHGLPV